MPRYHPDNSRGCEILFRSLVRAYDTLSDPSTRESHDLRLTGAKCAITHDQGQRGVPPPTSAAQHQLAAQPAPSSAEPVETSLADDDDTDGSDWDVAGVPDLRGRNRGPSTSMTSVKRPGSAPPISARPHAGEYPTSLAMVDAARPPTRPPHERPRSAATHRSVKPAASAQLSGRRRPTSAVGSRRAASGGGSSTPAVTVPSAKPRPPAPAPSVQRPASAPAARRTAPSWRHRPEAPRLAPACVGDQAWQRVKSMRAQGGTLTPDAIPIGVLRALGSVLPPGVHPDDARAKLALASATTPPDQPTSIMLESKTDTALTVSWLEPVNKVQLLARSFG